MTSKFVRHSAAPILCALALFLPGQISGQAVQGRLGIFEGQADVGSVTPPGTLSFDAASRTYTMNAAGANLWSTEDGFHFAWKKISGDVSLTADINLAVAAATSSPHRKALLMFRQTLDADGAYADVALHGSGETALQYRRTMGATTQDIAFNIGAPKRLRLEKRGDTITLFLSMGSEPLHQAGASIKLHFEGPFYAGIGLCAHNKDAVEKATFANVELTPLTPPAVPAKLVLYSTLETIAIDSNARAAMVVLSERGHSEAPNWSRDGKFLIFNRDGRLWTIPTEGGTATQIDIDGASDCTGSHGLSPDGQWIAMTCITPGNPGRRVYIVPAAGGKPRMVTERSDSYFHSWSPDGKTIAFTRPSHGSGNIYSISVDGGEETALTTGTGISDDPDYTPDGKYIYFNSDRAGGPMQIWRMHADGTQPEQVTTDEMNNWTPHPSPDGKSILILSYPKGVTGHPANKDVTLRILSAGDGKIRDLVDIVGGSGSDNVPDWAPDGAHFAFVSYQMLPEENTGSTERHRQGRHIAQGHRILAGWMPGKSSMWIWTPFTLQSNNAMIRNCAASRLLSPGWATGLSFARLLTKPGDSAFVPPCPPFAPSVSAPKPCLFPRISSATGPSPGSCAKSSSATPI
jgi:TolB protein